jgi:hypothetical protein
VCTQTSVTIGPSPGARWPQDVRHGTDAWETEYGKRNGIESFNARIKDPVYGALDPPQDGDVSGAAPQRSCSPR